MIRVANVETKGSACYKWFKHQVRLLRHWVRTDLYDFIFSPFNPVKRHRILYSNRWGWALYSVFLMVIAVGLIYIVSKCMGLTGSNVLANNNSNVNDNDNLLWSIISQFADAGNLHMANGKGALIAIVSAFLGIVCLSGLTVSSLVSFISQRRYDWQKGLIRYNFPLGRHFCFNNFVAIIGVNEQTATIVKYSLRRGIDYVLIQSNRDIEQVRAMVNLSLDKDDEKRVVFYHGDRTSEEDIKEMRLEDANEVFILGEDMHSGKEQDHDAYNMACLEHIARYMQRHPRRETLWWGWKREMKKHLRCHVNFEYQSTFTAFKVTHIYRSLNSNRIEFLPFNIQELWAKKVLVDNSAVVSIGKHSEKMVQRYLPLEAYWQEDATGGHTLKYLSEDSPQAVHLVVVGMNQMGVALAMQAALLVHLPNYHKQKSRKLRTTITFIDENAVRESEFLRSRYEALFSLCRYRTLVCSKQRLKDYPITHEKSWTDPMQTGRFSFMGENFMDLQWEFIEGSIASQDIRDYLSCLTEDIENRTTTIAVCYNNPQQSIATALYLPEKVLKRALQILVYQQNTFDMINKVATSEREWKRYEKLRPFGMIEGSYTKGLFNNMRAKLANLLYDDSKGVINGDTVISDTIVYRAERLWKDLGIVYKLANINLADSFPMKLRSLMAGEEEMPQLNDNDDRIKYLALAEHNRWLTERLTMGYRPLEERERESIVRNGTTTDKEFYKKKSRAHVDICSNDDVEIWDNATFKRNTDKKIITMTPTIIKWEQWACLREMHTGGTDSTHPALDMCEVAEGLWMGRHPISKKQWNRVMGSLPPGNDDRDDDMPVVNVSKDDVDNFILVLNKMTKLQFQLPSLKNLQVAARSKNTQLEDLEEVVWQWTSTPDRKYKSNYRFYGKSDKFLHRSWKRKSACREPNYKSSDLSFRLVLRYDFHIHDIDSPQRDYQLKEDDTHVIEELMGSMVKVNAKGEQAFYILPNPVTQRQWKAVMREKDEDTINPSEQRGDYYPVECVSYNDADAFVKHLNRKNPKGIVFRLPTYDEWMRAAKYAGADKMRIWHKGITRSTHRVETNFRPGCIYNMYGNIWEWCANYSNSNRHLPIGEDGIAHVMMGGSWRNTEEECLNPEGSYGLPDYKADDVGFRIVADSIG